MIQQISVFVENELGSIAKITEVLENNNIDIRAIAGFDGPTYSILRIIADKPEKAVDALRGEQYSAKMSTVIAVELKDEPGSLNKMLNLLKENGIGINYIYSFVLQRKEEPWMIMHVSDMDKGEDVLRKNGYTCMP